MNKLWILILALLLAACGAGTPTVVADLSTSTPGNLFTLQPEETVTNEPSDEATAEATVTEEPSRPAPSIPNPDAYTWRLVAEGFNRPLLVANAGDGSGRLFIVEQDGAIQVIAENQALNTPFLNIGGRVLSEGNEQGLLGLAFHPNYEDNGYFYVNYTDNNGDTVVARYSVSADANVADVDSEQIILQVDQPYGNHNGGHIEFGPDGYLYISLGDGGSGDDPGNNGQNPDTLLGSILRIDVDGGDPYAIPADNPFANGGGAPEIWFYGLRNPWRFTFDSETGDIYIADVGQNQYEEINFLPGGIAGGANFGWRYREGAHAYIGSPPEGLSLIDPVAEYQHPVGCSVTGGVVYRGNNLPEWNGVYLYGDFCTGVMFGLAQGSDGVWNNQEIYRLPINITSFGADESGEIYVLDRNGDLYWFDAE
mgnify:FL=1